MHRVCPIGAGVDFESSKVDFYTGTVINKYTSVSGGGGHRGTSVDTASIIFVLKISDV